MGASQQPAGEGERERGERGGKGGWRESFNRVCVCVCRAVASGTSEKSMRATDFLPHLMLFFLTTLLLLPPSPPLLLLLHLCHHHQQQWQQQGCHGQQYWVRWPDVTEFRRLGWWGGVCGHTHTHTHTHGDLLPIILRGPT